MRSRNSNYMSRKRHVLSPQGDVPAVFEQNVCSAEEVMNSIAPPRPKTATQRATISRKCCRQQQGDLRPVYDFRTNCNGYRESDGERTWHVAVRERVEWIWTGGLLFNGSNAFFRLIENDLGLTLLAYATYAVAASLQTEVWWDPLRAQFASAL